MTAFLIVTLAAPMASFGEQAGNARRSSAMRPTKSALIGLLGAALGVDRADADAQRALASGYRVATRTWSEGASLRDFHTYQSLPRGRSAATRADALAQRDALTTSLTVREYRSDVLFEAAYVAAEQARWPLERLAEALQRPRYALYLGRKACPLAGPLDPDVVDTETIDAAFQRYDAERRGCRNKDRLWRWREPGALAVEDEAWLAPRNVTRRRHRRYDQPGDRIAWAFSPRSETVVSPSEEP